MIPDAPPGTATAGGATTADATTADAANGRRIGVDVFADEAVAAMVADARRAGPGASTLADVPALRQGSRDRAAARPPGPAMPTRDSTVAGVPVRVYEPAADQPGAARIAFLHGGGFVVGDLDTHDAFVRRLAAATGATVVAVDYRRAPEHPFPAAVDDATAVVGALAAGGRPVAVAGDSAGAFLAVQAVLRLRHLPIAAQLLVCPLVDLSLDDRGAQSSVATKGTGFLLDVAELRTWIGWWTPDPAVRTDPACHPLRADLAGLPPALVVTVEHDPLRDGGDAYAARLAAAGVPVTHRVEPGLVHNFPTVTHSSPAAAAADARWLADASRVMQRSV